MGRLLLLITLDLGRLQFHERASKAQWVCIEHQKSGGSHRPIRCQHSGEMRQAQTPIVEKGLRYKTVPRLAAIETRGTTKWGIGVSN